MCEKEGEGVENFHICMTSFVDSRQISPKVGLMLRILDLISLARLAG